MLSLPDLRIRSRKNSVLSSNVSVHRRVRGVNKKTMYLKDVIAIDRQRDFICFHCRIVVPGNYLKLARHWRIVHGFLTSNRCRQHIVCGQNDCDQVFETFGSYRMHLKWCSKKYSPSNRDYRNLTETNENRQADTNTESDYISEMETSKSSKLRNSKHRKRV